MCTLTISCSVLCVFMVEDMSVVVNVVSNWGGGGGVTPLAPLYVP